MKSKTENHPFYQEVTGQGFDHDTVFADALIEMGKPQNFDGIAIDCTSGGGGHTAKLLQLPFRHVIAIDRDADAIEHLKAKFSVPWEQGGLRFAHGAFADIKSHLVQSSIDLPVVSIIADLGVSSPQLDRAERGFSFQKEGPLDMRMDKSSSITASTLINSAEESELSRLFFQLGEEPFARKIAAAIVRQRALAPIETTSQLADIISSQVKYKTKSRTHPATKCFQAIRMWVNDELGQLERLLHEGFNILAPNGKFAVITFHSLEDRMVKRFFREISEPKPMPRELPLTEVGHTKAILTKPFPLMPDQQEVHGNRRARSAKLRAIQKN